MSNFKLSDHIRFHLTAADSPTNLSGMQPAAGVSPVTDLTMNLSGTSLGSTPRRRLSLSSLDNTPTPVRVKPLQSGKCIVNLFPVMYLLICSRFFVVADSLCYSLN
jgi:hypothetical protein